MSVVERGQGLPALLWRVLRSPVPPQLRGDVFFGWLILVVFLLQVGTGILLSLYYQASPAMVAESVEYVMRDVDWGWLVRGVHHWSADALIVLCVLHLLRMLALGAYRGLGTSAWYIGLILLGAVVVATSSGALLAWDNQAYWHIHGALERIGRLPAAGPWLARVVRGGSEVGATTLSRMYSAHSLFVPWLIWMLLITNLWLLARRAASVTGGER